MNQLWAAAAIALAPYFMTTGAVNTATNDPTKAVAILRPMNETVEHEARSFVESLRRLERISVEHKLGKTQSFTMGTSGLLDVPDEVLPKGGVAIPLREIVAEDGTPAFVPVMPVVMRLRFVSPTGQLLRTAKFLLVYGRFKDGWHLADIEVLPN